MHDSPKPPEVIVYLHFEFRNFFHQVIINTRGHEQKLNRKL